MAFKNGVNGVDSDAEGVMQKSREHECLLAAGVQHGGTFRALIMAKLDFVADSPRIGRCTITCLRVADQRHGLGHYLMARLEQLVTEKCLVEDCTRVHIGCAPPPFHPIPSHPIPSILSRPIPPIPFPPAP